MKKLLFAVLCLSALLPLSGAVHAASNCSSDVPDAREALTFEDVQLSFVNMKDRGATYVITVGVLRNISACAVEDIQIEARHLDGEKRLIDVHEKYFFNTTLKPGEDLAFRIYEPAAQAQSAYASYPMRVVSANYAPAQETSGVDTPASVPSKNSAIQWKERLLNWFPLLLLIVVWLFFITRYSGAKSPAMRRAERQVELVERQVELTERQNTLGSALMERQAERMEQQNALIERIAAALEERNKS
jgi:ATP-dependent Zn protease